MTPDTFFCPDDAGRHSVQWTATADPRSTFYGKYIFGDYESQRIFALTQQDRTLKEIR